jgi:hypothetical protein
MVVASNVPVVFNGKVLIGGIGLVVTEGRAFHELACGTVALPMKRKGWVMSANMVSHW